MNKFNFLALFAFIGVSMARQVQLPFLANVCNLGCALSCNYVRNVCIVDAGVPVDCDLIHGDCMAGCIGTCNCVSACGPNCDEFEKNCRTLGIKPIGGVFCPVAGKVCDVSCVTACPQRGFWEVLKRVHVDIVNFHDSLVKDVITGIKSIGVQPKPKPQPQPKA